MDNKSVQFPQMVLLSRRIQNLFFISFPIGVILGMILKIKWLTFIAPSLICASWLVPGASIVFKAPWLAQAWLRGINSHFSAEPWDQLAKGQKFSIYFYSAICFLAAASLIILYVTSSHR